MSLSFCFAFRMPLPSWVGSGGVSSVTVLFCFITAMMLKLRAMETFVVLVLFRELANLWELWKKGEHCSSNVKIPLY